VSGHADGHQIASVVLDPEAEDTSKIINRISIDKRFDWYVFWSAGSNWQAISSRLVCNSPVTPQNGASTSLDKACDQDRLALLERNEEFQLLMGVDSTPAAFLDGRPVALHSLLH